MSDALERLADVLRADGGLLAGALASPAGTDGRIGAAVSDRGPDYAFLVEAIREGHLLHYGQGRVVRPADPDLALLGGDRLYALGLARLAQLGDLHAVAVLAEVISGCARAHAEGRPEDAEGIWLRGAEAIARSAAG